MGTQAEKSRKKRITLADVAQDANVSRATASLVVRNSPLIKETTRQRVLDSIDKLGYIYHRAAASMRSQNSNTIGLIIPDIINPFFAELTIGMEGYLEEKQYAVFMSNTTEQMAKQARLLNAMREYQVDGALLCPVNETPLAEIEALQKAHFPIVLVARYLYDMDVDYVGVDNVYGAQMAMEHLLKGGHSKIAFIGGAENSSARRDRLEGYVSGLAKAALMSNPQWIVSTPVTRAGGYDAIQSLLQLSDPPTAALCYNDIVAYGVLAGLKASHVEVGTSFALAGFDDLADARFQSPPLTTVAVPTNEIGEQAARTLLERIANPDLPTRQIVLRPKLIVRDSSILSST